MRHIDVFVVFDTVRERALSPEVTNANWLFVLDSEFED